MLSILNLPEDIESVYPGLRLPDFWGLPLSRLRGLSGIEVWRCKGQDFIGS